ncbi:BED-type domain-containing protein [Aphelenchoides besseyi]|nr:BED-type domain-containing protein [Aphelenchoides besseyi]
MLQGEMMPTEELRVVDERGNTRNQLSIESTASSSSVGLAPGSLLSLSSSQSSNGGTNSTAASGEQIPRKQDIQHDIRHNKGRFELVKKRGRSDVWRYFGQVIDKQTGSRLPYVACYACRVLYTDTGGGTGNMTRHRCSMGSSYRTSCTGSSLDAMGDTQSSSFDSVQAINGPTSPSDSTAQDPQQHSISAAAREAFAQSGGFHGSLGSSGYGSTSTQSQSFTEPAIESLNDTHRGFHRSASAGNTSCTTSGLLHPNSAVTAIQPESLHRSGSSLGTPSFSNLSTNLAVTPNNRSRTTTPIALQQQQPTLQLGQTFKPTPTRPTSQSHGIRQVPPIVLTGTGYVFTPLDRQLFAQSVIQFCAQDMHNYDMVAGEGFKNLIETVLFIGRRSHGDTQTSNSFDPVRNLIPDPQQLREVVMSQDSAVRKATINDLVSLKDVGISLTCQTVYFAGSSYICVTANYLTEEWQLTKRNLKVVQCQNPSVSDYVNAICVAMKENQIDDARKVLLSFDSDFDDSQSLTDLPKNIVVVKNVARALNNILFECFEIDSDRETTSTLIDLCKRILSVLLGRQLLIKEMPSNLSSIRLSGDDAQPLPEDHAVGIYSIVKFVKDHLSQIQRVFGELNETTILEEIRRTDWSKANEIELFLDAFYETVKAFTVHQEPVFHGAVTECFALLHAFSESNEAVEELSPTIHDTDEQERSEGVRSVESSSWVRSMRQAAEKRLKDWVDRNLRPEHYMAALLNPKLRQLQVICTDIERLQIYSQTREVAGLIKNRKEQSAESSRDDGEPSRKRRNFLIQLEDSAMEEDELESYLRMPLSQVNYKTVREFWSSFGERSFPKLSKFARFLLGTQCAAGPLRLYSPSSHIGADEINTFLKLRPEVYGTVNRLSCDSQRFQQNS